MLANCNENYTIRHIAFDSIDANIIHVQLYLIIMEEATFIWQNNDFKVQV